MATIARLARIVVGGVARVVDLAAAAPTTPPPATGYGQTPYGQSPYGG